MKFDPHTIDVLETTSEAFLALDRNFTILFANRAAKDMFPYFRDAHGKNLLKVLPDAKRNPVFPQVLEAVRSGEELIFETYYPPLDLWIEAKLHHTEDYIGIYFRDVNSRKSIEARLRESEERYRSFIGKSSEGIWRCELDKPIPVGIPTGEQVEMMFDGAYMAECNDAMARMYGFASAAELIGKRLTDLMDRDDLANIEYLRAFVESGYNLNGAESHEIDKYGNRLWFENNLIGIVENGQLLRAWGTQIDVSERKRLDAERLLLMTRLMQSESMFRTVTETIPHIVWTTDPDGAHTFFNGKWYEYTGLSVDESLGEGWRLPLHPQDAERASAVWAEALRKGHPYEVEYRFRRASDGQYRWFLGRALPLLDTDGTIVKWFGTCTDIDDQKRLDERKDEFIGIASHELKTPLTSIKAYTQILERIIQEMGNEKATRYLEKTNRYIDRLNSLIADLLDVSKIQSGKLQFNVEKFDIDGLVEDSIDAARLLSQRHRIIKEGTVRAQIQGDRHRLEQVFTNLISNAIKYSPQSDTVVVRVGKKKGFVVIAVEDSGIGISPSVQKRIFERFYRVEDVSKHFSGLGIGLYISSEIIQRHGGTIDVASTRGKGSVFTFTLPVVPRRKGAV